MSEDHSQYKVPKISEKYGLDGLGDKLVEFRSQEDGPTSLRELAEYFNKQVIQTVLQDAGMNPLEGEADNIYRLITDENTSSGVKIEARKRLEKDDIDVDELKSDFVSYQAIRTYLQECRDYTAESQTETEKIQKVSDNISRLQSRTITVTEQKLDQLDRTGRIDLGEFQVLSNIYVYCDDCNSRFNVMDLLEEGGCRCD